MPDLRLLLILAEDDILVLPGDQRALVQMAVAAEMPALCRQAVGHVRSLGSA